MRLILESSRTGILVNGKPIYKWSVEIPSLRTRHSWFSSPHVAIDAAMSSGDFSDALEKEELDVLKPMFPGGEKLK